MELRACPMTKELAEDILCWEYPPPYDLYNNEYTEDALKELMENLYEAILDGNGTLTGFYCLGDAAIVPAGITLGLYREPAVDIGIGMNPALTGKGNRKIFFSFILDVVMKTFLRTAFRLTAAAFNERAIKLYMNAGFQKADVFNHDGETFIIMLKY
ncbi:N-acetyltransferase [Bacillus sp. REN3]|uniref:N-acetyltransferase n=1 Tax=Bacillus sp. REN3 TaxID=2802440 RepID=UPI001AED34EC|nr:N-acetyltransferase [Bacillus sp. REN3]